MKNIAKSIVTAAAPAALIISAASAAMAPVQSPEGIRVCDENQSPSPTPTPTPTPTPAPRPLPPTIVLGKRD